MTVFLNREQDYKPFQKRGNLFPLPEISRVLSSYKSTTEGSNILIVLPKTFDCWLPTDNRDFQTTFP